MSQKKIHVFLSHGLESGPDSTKIQALKAEAEHFPDIEALALDHQGIMDPAVRIKQMLRAMDSAGADPERTILVGSSMGGWVCAETSARTPVLGCFLLAPALAMPRYPDSHPEIQASQTQIIHGWQDDVVEPMPVIELAQKQNLSILMLADGHRLADSLNRIVAEFRLFMHRCLGGED